MAGDSKCAEHRGPAPAICSDARPRYSRGRPVRRAFPRSERSSVNQFIIGAIVLYCFWRLLRQRQLAASPILDSLIRRLLVGFAGVAAALALARGNVGLALPLGVFVAAERGWLPDWRTIWPFSAFFGRVIYIRSQALVLEMDTAGNPLDGMVVAGRYRGRRLSALGTEELGLLREEVRLDPYARSILEAYLDRRHARWREYLHEDPATGPRERARPPAAEALTKQQAYELLGIQPGASADDIRKAHRTLMKKLHPDKGGATHLAARVNEARDLLLGGH